MKPVKLWILIGATAVGLTWARATLCAQPASDAIATDGDDKPWNQGVPLATRLAARALFFEGNRLFQIPLFAQAAETYTAALSEWKQPRIYFNLALAQLNLGQDVEARDSLSHALDHGAEALDPKDFQEAQKQLRDLERKLGRIRISCQTDGAEVILDGAALFTGPGSREVWVKPRTHEITAKRPDFLSETRRVLPSTGELKNVELRLITLHEAEDSSRRWAIWKPWAVVAAGAAIAAASGGLHALSVHTFHSYDHDFALLPCAKSGGCTMQDVPDDLNTRLNHASLEQKFAIAGYFSGGGLMATGVILLYLNRPRLTEQPAISTLSGSIAATPLLTMNLLGLQLTIHY